MFYTGNSNLFFLRDEGAFTPWHCEYFHCMQRHIFKFVHFHHCSSWTRSCTFDRSDFCKMKKKVERNLVNINVVINGSYNLLTTTVTDCALQNIFSQNIFSFISLFPKNVCDFFLTRYAL